MQAQSPSRSHTHTQKLKPTRSDLRISKKQHWDGKRKGFFVAVGMSFWMLQLLFLTVMSLLYGSQYKNSQKVHNLNVLAVDYDGGLVGEALVKAYDGLQSNAFPTIHLESVPSYPDVESIKEIVHEGRYWAAVYTWPNASSRLSAALTGGEPAATFNSQEMISFIWLESRYPTTSEAFIQSNLNQLIAASATALKQSNGMQALRTLNQTDSAAVSAYLNPIVASSLNLMPMHQGDRVLYNTASVALSIIQMFFFILAINGVSGAMNLFSRLSVITNILIRQGLAAAYTFIAALFEITYIWAFKEDWQLHGYVFVLFWMITWLHMWINFMVIDSAACFLPMQYMPYVIISYVLLNITSSLVCIPIAPVFYRYAYAMPSHNWYEAFITIATNGAVNTLYRSLPILFSWFVLGQIVSVPAMTFRCRSAQAMTTVAQANVDSEDVEKLSADDLSSSDTVTENGTGTHISQPPSRVAVATPEASVGHQSPNAYFPSIPVGFEGIEKILSRES